MENRKTTFENMTREEFENTCDEVSRIITEKLGAGFIFMASYKKSKKSSFAYVNCVMPAIEAARCVDSLLKQSDEMEVAVTMSAMARMAEKVLDKDDDDDDEEDEDE